MGAGGPVRYPSSSHSARDLRAKIESHLDDAPRAGQDLHQWVAGLDERLRAIVVVGILSSLNALRLHAAQERKAIQGRLSLAPPCSTLTSISWLRVRSVKTDPIGASWHELEAIDDSEGSAESCNRILSVQKSRHARRDDRQIMGPHIGTTLRQASQRITPTCGPELPSRYPVAVMSLVCNDRLETLGC